MPSALCTLSHEHPHGNVMGLLKQRHSFLGIWRRDVLHWKGSKARKEFLCIHDLMALFSVSFEYVDHRQCCHFLILSKEVKG